MNKNNFKQTNQEIYLNNKSQEIETKINNLENKNSECKKKLNKMRKISEKKSYINGKPVKNIIRVLNNRKINNNIEIDNLLQEQIDNNRTIRFITRNKNRKKNRVKFI